MQKGILSFNNASGDVEIIVEGVPAIIMPVKGQIINLNLDGSSKEYRVIKTTGSVAEVLALWDLSFSQKYWSTNQTTSFTTPTGDTLTGTKYSGSDLDNTLTSWYNNSLTTTAKEVINSAGGKNIIQNIFQLTDTIPTTGQQGIDYWEYQYNFKDTNRRFAVYKGTTTVGNRYVYALDIKDIGEYFDNVPFTSAQLNTMYFNSPQL